MPQTEIEIHFNQMRDLSQELQEVAKKLKRTVDTAGMETISKTREAWISVHTDIFVGKEVKLFEKMGETAMNLGDISTEIYDKARKIYESERQNAMTARIRSYL